MSSSCCYEIRYNYCFYPIFIVVAAVVVLVVLPLFVLPCPPASTRQPIMASLTLSLTHSTPNFLNQKNTHHNDISDTAQYLCCCETRASAPPPFHRPLVERSLPPEERRRRRKNFPSLLLLLVLLLLLLFHGICRRRDARASPEKNDVASFFATAAALGGFSLKLQLQNR